MATDSQSVGEGGTRIFYAGIKIFYKLSANSIEEDECRFPSDIRGFWPIGLVGISFCCLWCKKPCCESQKKSLEYWWYFWSSEMHFSEGIECFRLLFLQCVLEMKNKNFRFELKQTETRSVSRLFRFVSWNPKKKFRFVSVFRSYIETTETNRTVSKRTETIQYLSNSSWTHKLFLKRRQRQDSI